MSRIFMFLMFGCTFFSALSQTLLKQSANRPHANSFLEFFNWRVITAYVIFALVLLANTYAYTQVPYRYGSIIDSFTYVFVLLMSHFWLKEKITKGKLLGNLLIVCGILVYSL